MGVAWVAGHAPDDLTDEKAKEHMWDTFVTAYESASYRLLDVPSRGFKLLGKHLLQRSADRRASAESQAIDEFPVRIGVEIETCVQGTPPKTHGIMVAVNDSSIKCDSGTTAKEYIVNDEYHVFLHNRASVDALGMRKTRKAVRTTVSEGVLMDDISTLVPLLRPCNDESCGMHVHMSSELHTVEEHPLLFVILQHMWLSDYQQQACAMGSRRDNFYCPMAEAAVGVRELEKYSNLNLLPTFSDVVPSRVARFTLKLKTQRGLQVGPNHWYQTNDANNSDHSGKVNVILSFTRKATADEKNRISAAIETFHGVQKDSHSQDSYLLDVPNVHAPVGVDVLSLTDHIAIHCGLVSRQTRGRYHVQSEFDLYHTPDRRPYHVEFRGMGDAMEMFGSDNKFDRDGFQKYVHFLGNFFQEALQTDVERYKFPEVVDLSFLHLTNADPIIDALQNPSLRSINLSGNVFSGGEAFKLWKALYHSTVTTVVYEHNLIDEATFQFISMFRSSDARSVRFGREYLV